MFDKNYTRKQKEIQKYMIVLTVFIFAVALCSYQGEIRSYNTTMLALSYQYGFTSRSLLGTIYHMLNALLPVDMMNYRTAMGFAWVVTGVFFCFLLAFSYLCLKRCSEECLKPVEYLLLFLVLFVVSSFSGAYNFFRVDLFMVMTALIGALLLAYGKAEWLVIPLSAVGVMFHQGYVFMFFNIALVLLVYRFLSVKGREQRKYAVLFLVALIVGSALFLWFEFFSRSNGEAYYEQIVDEARKLSLNGYHTTLLLHEVLGIDLGQSEEALHKINFTQLPILTVLFLPYIIVTVRFFANLIKKAQDFRERLKYLAVVIGAVTMVPNFILKIDYGRWILAVIVYYIVVAIALCMMGDRNVQCELRCVYDCLRSKPWVVLWILIPVFFVPLWDVDINGFLEHAGWWFNDHLLHWYTF